MARKQIQFTEKKIEQFIKEGRGQGEGKNYIPWIKVGEFSSEGRGNRIFGVKTNRIHHFLSDLEARYYYILMWSDVVTDVREQFPLFPVSETEQLAHRLNVQHPRTIGTNISNVMTTDFLITLQQNDKTILEARSVKYSHDLENRRTLEKQAIEREYWAERGIPWKLVTEESISTIKANNIKKLLGYYSAQLTDVSSGQQRELLTQRLINALITEKDTLRNLTAALDIEFGLPDGSALSMFYHLAAHKIIPVDINVKILPSTYSNSFVDIEQLSARSSIRQGGATLEHHA